MSMIFWAMYGRKAPFHKDSDHHYKDKITAGKRPKVEDSWHKGFVKVRERKNSGVFKTVLVCTKHNDPHFLFVCFCGKHSKLLAFLIERDRTGGV